MKSANIQHSIAMDKQCEGIEVSLGERVYMNWGAMQGGMAGEVVGFRFDSFYMQYEMEIKLDNGKSHWSSGVTEYGIGCYLERLGGLGIFAKKSA